MTQVAEANRTWYAPIEGLLSQHRRSGGFIISLPDYRPDLVRSLASCLGLAYFDFRLEVMQPLGWKAIDLGLQDLDRSLIERVLNGGLIAQNVDALLATKPASERKHWVTGFLDTNWPRPVVVPLTLYGQEAPGGHSRVVALSAEEMPEQTLLSRLLQ